MKKNLKIIRADDNTAHADAKQRIFLQRVLRS